VDFRVEVGDELCIHPDTDTWNGMVRYEYYIDLSIVTVVHYYISKLKLTMHLQLPAKGGDNRDETPTKPHQ